MRNAVKYIKKSSEVDGAITGKIALSADGVTWEYLSKEQMQVGCLYSGTPEANYGLPTKTIVVLKFQDRDIPFEAQDVKNQSGWIAGTRASLNTAMADIMKF